MFWRVTRKLEGDCCSPGRTCRTSKINKQTYFFFFFFISWRWKYNCELWLVELHAYECAERRIWRARPTFVIFFLSVTRSKCPSKSGFTSQFCVENTRISFQEPKIIKSSRRVFAFTSVLASFHARHEFRALFFLFFNFLQQIFRDINWLFFFYCFRKANTQHSSVFLFTVLKLIKFA